jgi:hypothetical protein
MMVYLISVLIKIYLPIFLLLAWGTFGIRPSWGITQIGVKLYGKDLNPL